MNRGRIAWLVAIADILVLAVLLAVTETPWYAALLFLAGVASYAGVGALLLSRVPGNPVGVLLSTIGTAVVLNVSLTFIGALGQAQSPPWPWASWVTSLASALFIVPLTLGVVGVPLVFPDGRLPSSRYRWIVALMVAALAAWLIGAVSGIHLDLVVLVALPVAFVGGSLATINRFRRGGPAPRAQIKWLASIVVVAAATALAGLFLNESQPELSSALMVTAVITLGAMPIAIGIAVLRYRLYEIDRIISRTIGWAIVTSGLLGVFAVLVVGLQTLLDGVTQGDTLPVAISTLVAAALFQPIRRRVQHAVDRRFDRTRYDGELTAAAFAERLRDRTDLAGLEQDLQLVADASVRPAAVDIWLRSPAGARE